MGACRQEAFTTSSMIPAIYIQQFWDTMRYDSTTGIYRCQLDEQWFNLHKDILRDALQISPIIDNNPFVAPPSNDAVIEYVNTLGYPCTLRNVSVMFGIIHHSNIDYAERIWEEFVQSIQTFLTDKKRLTMTLRRKKKSTPLLIPSMKFTKLIIHHLKTKHNIHPRTGIPLHYSHDDNILGNLRFVRKDGREVFGMSIPDALLTDAIKRAPYYDGYLAHVAEYQQYLDGEHGITEEGAVPESPTAKSVPKKKQKLVKETPDEPSPAKRLKGGLVGKRRKPKSPLKLVDEFAYEGVPISEPRIDDKEADYQRAVELSLKDLEAKNQGPARTVVIREPHFGRFQPLPKVQGKGKEKVIEEQVARDLLTLQTPKKKSPADQFIFQRHIPMTTEPFGNAESPSLDAELALADSETESDEVVTLVNKEKYDSNEELTKINTGVQDEGQAGPNHGKQDEGQAGSNPDLAVSDASTQQNPEQMDKEFTTTAYPNNSASLISSSWRSHGKKNQRKPMLNQRFSQWLRSPFIRTPLFPSMTTPVIDLTTSQLDSLTVHAPLPTSTATTITVTTTTTLPPPPLQPQQSTTDSILLQRIGELEQHMENLIQDNSALEERLNKHGSRLYNLENLNIPQKVSKAVDEIVTDAVDWALQAPLRARFRELSEADMKEILLQRMWETGSYKTHEDHKNLYEALEKSMNRDHSNQLQANLAEAHKKRRKRSDSPRTPFGSPPPPPPPHPPSSRDYDALGAPGASGSSQIPPPPPPPSTTVNQQQGMRVWAL
ncbi:hypothetical protein Tco_0033676 [Tanacetum coccineum]